MLKKERQNAILEMIQDRKYCTVNFFAGRLFVAPMTIRRDLREMEAAGVLTRLYGGATIPDYENREIPFELRSKSNHPVKERLAKQAAALIHTGDVVFLDASSTVNLITEHLLPEQNLTVITNSTLVAQRLKEKHIRCYLTGGMPVENSYALVGSIAEKCLADLHANICFFSAQGIDETGCISDQSEAETALRRLFIQNSGKQYFLFDGSKYGKRFAFKICSATDITGVITDLASVAFQ